MLPDSFVILKAAPLIALGAYAALYLAGTCLLWLAERGRGRLPALDKTLRSRAFPWLIELVRPGYYLLLPYYALVRGLISAQGLGVGAGLDWPQGILRAGGWTLFALFLLGLGWLAFRRALAAGRAASRPASPGLCLQCNDQIVADNRPENLVLSAAPWGWLYTLREAAYLEMSWGFYRTACSAFVGSYYGAFLGLGLVYLVSWLNPATRAGLGLPGKREAIIHTASLALCSAVLYTQTGNLWLCATMHALLELALARWTTAKQDR